MKALGNGADGVIVHAGATNVTIGGAYSGAGNVISANGGDGVDINSASNVTVKGNDIGTDKKGDLTTVLANSGWGVAVSTSSNVQIGQLGSDPTTAQNTIYGNGLGAIDVDANSTVTIGTNHE